MDNLQLRVLYRQFLFRVFDLEMLSSHAQGDASKLLGQFAALLIFVSLIISLGALLSYADPSPNPTGRSIGLVFAMIAQHFLIATTMLVVGLFGVLSWDATFPDRRDVLVLGPLPVPARTMFLAKVMAVAGAVGLTMLLLHSLMGLILPLAFAMHAAPATLPALTLDPTPVPPEAGDLQVMMDRDLRQQLTSGQLAPGTGAGMVIGVWKRGERKVLTYGAARSDSLFEIASISKTFTGLLLAQMVAKDAGRFDDPVRNLLPPGLVPKPAGQEITLLDLATHHSGLPRMPSNFLPADRSNPYADYGEQQLQEYVARHGVAKPEEAEFSYSNLGFGLLGHVVARRTGMSYAYLLRTEIAIPLHMTDTVITLSPDQKQRFMQGHDDRHRPVNAWDLNALAGAGAIRSTAGDMLRYLEANLHPEKHPSLSAALALSHQIRDNAAGGSKIALAWFYDADSGRYSHNGATAGFTSYVFFNQRADCAAVVLINNGPNLFLAPDLIGEHIWQRLSGTPAISLDTVLVPASTGFGGVLRSFGTYWFSMLAAGVFVYFSILATQGVAALVLPRPYFLRVSAYLQLIAICIIVGVYFLQPGFGGLDDLTIGSVGRVVQWLPSYWFLALYQQLNGSLHPALQPLALRAWIGLASLVFLTPLIYTLSYWRTLRKIVEEPDITPGPRRLGWLPPLGNQTQSAIGQFSVRTLARSKQHRLIVGFYLGIGLAFTCLFLKGPKGLLNHVGQEESMLLWAASTMMMILATVGARVAFSMPRDLRANWIFRVVGARGGRESLAASRRALLLLAVAPVWLATGIACMALWPGRQNAGHLAALGILGLILTDICLLGFGKIPFTCSYLPGKTRFHLAFLGGIGLVTVCSEAAILERRALLTFRGMSVMLALLAAMWAGVRWRAVAVAKEQQELRFEEEEPPAIQGLGLYRDGVVPIQDRSF